MATLGGVSPDGTLLRRTLQLESAARRRSKCLRGAAINGAVLLALAADLSSKCEGYTSILHWVELGMAAVAGANLLRLAAVLIPAAVLSSSEVTHADTSIRSQDRSLASLADSASRLSSSSDELSLSLSPRRQWRSAPASPPPSPPGPTHSLVDPPAADRFIADRQSLADYLQQYEDRRLAAGVAETVGASRGVGAGSAPQYQLAAAEGSPAAEERPAGAGGPGALWGRLHLDPQKLTQFNLNLRLWLHVTILERLVREMEAADAALARLGLGAALGEVAPERLRALASTQPALAQLLPFLEPFADQRYAVRRVRELARGPCLSEFKWSGGGAGWDDSQPTDSELLLSLLAAYLDAQLAGAAGAGAKAFSGHHLSAGTTIPSRGLWVHRVATRPPHYVLALDGAPLEVARGRNNLLHTLLVFIAAAAARPELALRRLHLGGAGLNMLWIIGR